MSLNPTRESIYSALATLVFNDTGVAAIFKTTGRWARHFQQIPGGGAACPALYLVEHPGEEHVRVGKGISDKRTLKALLVGYFYDANPSESNAPATQINNGLDAIEFAINYPGNPGNVQTLGGLVEHVYIEGALTVAEGFVQEFSVVNVPITILIP